MPTKAKTAGEHEAFALYRRVKNINEVKEDTWHAMTEYYMKQFEVNRKEFKDFSVASKLLAQVHGRLVTKYARPPRQFQSSGASMIELELVKDSVDFIQKRGGLSDLLSAKWSSHHKMFLLGDTWIRIGTSKNPAKPVLFSSSGLMNTFVDPFATQMRSESGVSDATEAFSIDIDDYESALNKAKENGWKDDFSIGKLPVDEQTTDRLEVTFEQDTEQDITEVEIGYYWNIKDKKNPYYDILAGSTGEKIASFKGEAYPFIDLDGNPFIPLIQLGFMPVPQGIYHGGLAIIYDLALVQEKLRNLALLQVQDNVNPIIMANIIGDANDFLSQMQRARLLRSRGEKGYIINSLSGTGAGTSKGELTALNAEQLTGEFERMSDELETEIKRLRFPIDDADIPASQLATNTVAMAVASSEFMRQVQRENKAGYRDMDMMTMALMRDNIELTDDTPFITNVETEDGLEVNGEGVAEENMITLGDAVELIDKYTLDVNLNIDEQDKLEKLIPALVNKPETQSKIVEKLARMDGIKLPKETPAPEEAAGELAPPDRQEQIEEKLTS